jgi:hypothetical protein
MWLSGMTQYTMVNAAQQEQQQNKQRQASVAVGMSELIAWAGEWTDSSSRKEGECVWIELCGCCHDHANVAVKHLYTIPSTQW